MSKAYVLVADSAIARIFAAETPLGALSELEVLTHPESRLHERDLVSDLPGRSFDTMGEGRHGMEVNVRPKQQEALDFAGEVARRLEAAHARHEFSHLLLVAAPEFLGLLRGKLSAQVRERVSHEVAKNLAKHSPEDIRQALPDRLYSTV
jgi:protein required for attachment to host cells